MTNITNMANIVAGLVDSDCHHLPVEVVADTAPLCRSDWRSCAVEHHPHHDRFLLLDHYFSRQVPARLVPDQKDANSTNFTCTTGPGRLAEAAACSLQPAARGLQPFRNGLTGCVDERKTGHPKDWSRMRHLSLTSDHASLRMLQDRNMLDSREDGGHGPSDWWFAIFPGRVSSSSMLHVACCVPVAVVEFWTGLGACLRQWGLCL